MRAASAAALACWLCSATAVPASNPTPGQSSSACAVCTDIADDRCDELIKDLVLRMSLRARLQAFSSILEPNVCSGLTDEQCLQTTDAAIAALGWSKIRQSCEAGTLSLFRPTAGMHSPLLLSSDISRDPPATPPIGQRQTGRTAGATADAASMTKQCSACNEGETAASCTARLRQSVSSLPAAERLALYKGGVLDGRRVERLCSIIGDVMCTARLDWLLQGLDDQAPRAVRAALAGRRMDASLLLACVNGVLPAAAAEGAAAAAGAVEGHQHSASAQDASHASGTERDGHGASAAAAAQVQHARIRAAAATTCAMCVDGATVLSDKACLAALDAAMATLSSDQEQLLEVLALLFPEEAAGLCGEDALGAECLGALQEAYGALSDKARLSALEGACEAGLLITTSGTAVPVAARRNARIHTANDSSYGAVASVLSPAAQMRFATVTTDAGVSGSLVSLFLLSAVGALLLGIAVSRVITKRRAEAGVVGSPDHHQIGPIHEYTALDS